MDAAPRHHVTPSCLSWLKTVTTYALAVTTTGLAIGQQTTSPSPVKFTHALKPSVMHMKAVPDPDTVKSSQAVYFYDTLNYITWHGRKALKRETATTLPGDTNFVAWATVIFDPVTLLPYLSEYRRIDGTFIKHEFDGTKVTETKNCVDYLKTPRREPGAVADTIVTHYVLPVPAFTWLENSGLPILLASPLRRGFKGSVPVISGDSSKMFPWTSGSCYVLRMSYQVMGKEKIMGLSGKEVKAWKVWVPETKFWFWISCRNPRMEGVTWPALNGMRYKMEKT